MVCKAWGTPSVNGDVKWSFKAERSDAREASRAETTADCSAAPREDNPRAGGL